MTKIQGELMSNGMPYARIFTIREDMLRLKCRIHELREIEDVAKRKSLKKIEHMKNSIRKYNTNLQHYCNDTKIKALYDLEVYEAQIELDEIKSMINKLKVVNEKEDNNKKDEIIKRIVKDFGLSHEYFIAIGHGDYYRDNF